MKIFLLPLLISIFLQPIKLRRKLEIAIKGTIIIGVICKDGILIAADSRGAIMGNENKIMAYVDSLPKIGLLNDRYPIAFAGKSTLKERFVMDIIQDFPFRTLKGAGSTFNAFRNYIFGISNQFDQHFIGGGFHTNGLPYIFSFTKDSGSIEGNSVVFNHPNFEKCIKDYVDTLRSSQEWGHILQKIIPIFAKKEKLTQEIGGPISMILIDKGNNIHWLQNNFLSKREVNYTDFVNKIERKEIKVNFVNGYKFEDVVSFMKTNPKYHPAHN